MFPKPPESQTVVIFGASGDLARRKLLPAFYHLFLEGLLPNGLAIVGYARTRIALEDYRESVRTALREFARTEPRGEDWDEFRRHLFYRPGGFDTEGAMDHLRTYLDTLDRDFGIGGGRLYYCATPPTAYPLIAARLDESGLNQGSKIVIEKPFGHDLRSARELAATLHRVFDESQIFRIDHYLGKETVQNILALRFANGMFEPIWNRRYLDHVQITAAEDIGIDDRGVFYEGTGAFRDMLVTHLLQVLTFFAMEPPSSFDPDRLRDEKVRVLRSMKILDPSNVVLGQYRGYLGERGVAAHSSTETFAAALVEIDNWRWAGVPFFLRAGKKLRRKATEVTLVFRDVPYNAFAGTDATPPGPDRLTVRVQPNEGISLDLNIKKPGVGLALDRATLEFDYERMFHAPLAEAYELLLLEAMEGDHTLFIREDTIDRAWEVVTRVLERPPPLVPYEPGSWGPTEADDLLRSRRWHLSPSEEF